MAYVRGQAIVSLLIGLSAGLAMELLGILGIFPDGDNYALAFGVWAMVTEAIPYVGPILGAIPPVVVALFDVAADGGLGGSCSSGSTSSRATSSSPG